MKPYSLMIGQFDTAHRRFARATTHTRNAVASAETAIGWAMLLDSALCADDSVYPGLTGPGADLMLALRWIASRAPNPLLTSGSDMSAPRWAARGALPPGPVPAPRHGEAAYRDQMEGRPADSVLEATAHWFAAETGRPGSLILGAH